MEGDHGDYEAVACRKQNGSRSDCPRSPEFNQLQEKPGIEMRALALGNGVAHSTQKMALNENIGYRGNFFLLY